MVYADVLNVVYEMFQTVALYCVKAYNWLTTYKVQDVIDALSDVGNFLTEIVAWLLEVVLSSETLDMYLYEFLLFGGFVTCVFLAIYRIIH